MSRTEELKITFPSRIAVVNRGEAAVRLIRAVRELNAEYDCGIKTVALHTDAERRAMFVRQADEAVTLRKTSAGIAYLDHAELERALLESKADAVWVGWGFVAEDIAFAELCARLNLMFIGPSPGRDADPGRQGRGQTPGREGGRTARTVERWPRRDPRGRPPARRGHRLPADHQSP